MNGNTLRTGKCRHCGKTVVEHLCYDPKNGILGNGPIFCGEPNETFEDSGLAALDAHKEELYEAIVAYKDNYCLWGDVENILNQIEKEK